MAPNLQFSLASLNGGPPVIHRISPALLDSILEHPACRYSRLASTVSNTLHTLSIETSSSSNTTTTISLPQRTDPAAFLVLIRFLEFGNEVYNPVTNELREKDRNGGEAIVLVSRDSVRKVFISLTVEWPWESIGTGISGFGGNSGGVVGFGSAYGTGFGSGEELSVGYVRPREDYSSNEVYQAYREQVRDDLFSVMTISDSPPNGNSEKSGGRRWEEGTSGAFEQSSGAGPSSQTHSNSQFSTLGNPAMPPSYESSFFTHANQQSAASEKNRQDIQSGPSFQQTLDHSILTLLTTLLDRHIQPAIHQQALHGMFNGTFILLAASPITRKLKVIPSDEEIITSFAKRSEYRKIIHLGDQGAGEPGFLVQESVIAMIKKGLAKELSGTNGNEDEEARRAEAEYREKLEAYRQYVPPPPPPPPTRQNKKGKGGWFGLGKKAVAVVFDLPPPESTAPPPPPPPPLPPKPKKGSMVVDVEAVDIWIRRESELGLLETEQTKGVVIWVETVV